jgi:hypothetical protein
VSTVEAATLGQVAGRIAAEDRNGSVFAGSLIGGRPGEGSAPRADVVLSVGEIGADLDQGRRTTRPVEMTVTTPDRETSRAFEFGGDDERVRSFATIAGLHLIRIALQESAQG